MLESDALAPLFPPPPSLGASGAEASGMLDRGRQGASGSRTSERVHEDVKRPQHNEPFQSPQITLLEATDLLASASTQCGIDGR